MTRWKYDYTDRRFGKTFSDLGKVIKNSWIKHRVIVCDIYADYDQMQQKEYYIREVNWTDEKPAQLHEQGYRIAEGCPDHDNIAWAGVPVFMKLHGFKMLEVDGITNNTDDPMFLNDRMNNNLLNKFAKSLARAAALAGMDLQKLILMGAIGIAAVIGMKVFGVF